MKYSIYGTPSYSTWEISEALRYLNVSHSIIDSSGKLLKINMKRAQPKWVHVSLGTDNKRKDSVNFIVSSFGELGLTNIPLFPNTSLEVALKTMLIENKSIELKIRKMGPSDYVEMITKPSLLNLIQTQLYKIQPYSLRKEAQTLILKFFNSKLGERQLMDFLKRNFKTESLIPLIKEGKGLREAVATLTETNVEEVSKRTGYPTFELLYLRRT